MCTRRGRRLSLVATAIVLFWQPIPTHAGSVTLGSSGWNATWSPYFDNPSPSPTHVGVQYLSEDTQAVHIRIDSLFGGTLNPWGSFDAIAIGFQGAAIHTPYVVIDGLSINNRTTQAWTGFRFTLLGGNTGTPGDTHFDAALNAIGQPNGVQVQPFATYDYQHNNQILTLGGGLIAPPGAPSALAIQSNGINLAGGLVISAGDMSTFTLKELPTPGEVPAPATFSAGLLLLSGAAIMRLKYRRVQ